MFSNKKSWKISVIELGRAYVNYVYEETLRARKPDVGYKNTEFSSYEGQRQSRSSISFESKIDKTLDFYDEVDVVKFWNAPYHTDNLWYQDSFFIVVPYQNFYIQIKGEPEALLKKGKAYAFNQRRLHRAHNSGKPFVCFVCSATKSSVFRYLKQNKLAY